MSVYNGYKDVLVRKAKNSAFEIHGLSPDGHAYVNSVFAPEGTVHPDNIGTIVAMIVRDGLSVEVR